MLYTTNGQPQSTLYPSTATNRGGGGGAGGGVAEIPANFPNATLANLLFNPILTTLLAFILDRPLYELYMFGPSLWGYGFHEGKEHSLICAEYTGITQTHWIINAVECEALIMRKFNALLITLHFTMYVGILCCVLWSLCGCAVFFCCCRRRKTQYRHTCSRRLFRTSGSNNDLTH